MTPSALTVGAEAGHSMDAITMSDDDKRGGGGDGGSLGFLPAGHCRRMSV